MEWFIDNWFVMVAIMTAILLGGMAFVGFFGLPCDRQKEKIKEWLIWACIEAERSLKSGTGKLKLREVWSMFVSIPAFSFAAKHISFEMFELWVTESLSVAKNMLIANPSLAEYVYGEEYEKEIRKMKDQLAKEALPDLLKS